MGAGGAYGPMGVAGVTGVAGVGLGLGCFCASVGRSTTISYGELQEHYQLPPRSSYTSEELQDLWEFSGGFRGGASAARVPPLPSHMPILKGFSRALKQALACQNRSRGSKVTGFESLALKKLQKCLFWL